MTHSTKTWPIFSQITNRADALLAIKNASVFFTVLVGAYIASFIKLERLMNTGFQISPFAIDTMLAEMAVYAAGAFILLRTNSRATAILLLLISCFDVTNIVILLLQGKLHDNITFVKLIQLLVLWSSIRAVEATFKLHKKFSANK